ncbi:MAG TPA: Glu-tRNA(Gln) amidotransferase subunit GatD [Methanosarcinales archaeon]|nr:Glu-tRNA(Gln) amidotransferase subunit GatD [Methanosarcinales archaeon]
MEFEQGDRIRVEKNNIVYTGILMPSTSDTEDYIVIKLDNGYNVGLKKEECRIELIESKKKLETKKLKPYTLPVSSKYKVSILSTGGTIASKVDYRTGAVTSQFTAEDILLAIPELSEIANYNAKVIYSILSENMRVEYWIELARAVAKEIKNGSYGVIITHGTDTMTYTSAALSFMLSSPVPIVLVGSQRSADRPSSDNAMNAICAASVAVSDIAEVCVVMHGTTSDDYCLIHRGTKVRKMHTSRRDAFQSINANPIGRVNYPSREIEVFSKYTKRGEKELKLRDSFEPRCALIKYSTGANPEILNYYRDNYKGIVIEGTGLGHVSTEWIPYIKNVTDAGIPVVITSQCINGRVCDRVYDTGRDIIKAGAIQGEDMLPEVALVKLMWTLGQTKDYDEVYRLMRENLAGEITSSTVVNLGH